MPSLTVPFMPLAKLEAAVGELVSQFERWRGAAVVPPVPVEDIIEKYLGVTLETIDLRAKLGIDDVLGAAYFGEKIIRIQEDLLDQEGRFSFTVGHETGHWWLHRPLYEANKAVPQLFPGEPEPDVICRSGGRKPPAEWQADAFAAQLLLPERFVREAFRAEVGNDPLVIEGLDERANDRDVLTRWRDLAATVLAAGKFTNVSNEAMRYRLRDLGLACARAAAVRSLF